MKLFFRKVGEGKPLIILHGLFGMGDNWTTLSKSYADSGYACYLVDQRNHGRSPHSEEFSYQRMAEDLLELVVDLKLSRIDLLGHSMGGKTAMFFAQANPSLLNKLIIADIAPKLYAPQHDTILAALRSLDFSEINSRKQAEEQLRISIRDEATIQFLLKNLYWKDEKLAWRFNREVIEREYAATGMAVPASPRITTPTLFLKGERSGYISKEDEKEIGILFSDSRIVMVPDSGHWVHADNPAEFFRLTIQFLNTDGIIK